MRLMIGLIFSCISVGLQAGGLKFEVEYSHYSTYSHSYEIKGCGIDQFGHVLRYESGVNGTESPLTFSTSSKIDGPTFEKIEFLGESLYSAPQLDLTFSKFADVGTKIWKMNFIGASHAIVLKRQGDIVGTLAAVEATELIGQLDKICGLVGEDLSFTEH